MRTVGIMLFESLQRQSLRFFIRTSPGARSCPGCSTTSSGVHMAISFGLLDLIAHLPACDLRSGVHVRLELGARAAVRRLRAGSVRRQLPTRQIEQGDNGEGVRQLRASRGSFVSGRLNIDGFVLLNGFGYDKRRDTRRFGDMATELMRLSVRQRMLMQGHLVIFAALPVLVFSRRLLIRGDAGDRGRTHAGAADGVRHPLHDAGVAGNGPWPA